MKTITKISAAALIAAMSVATAFAQQAKHDAHGAHDAHDAHAAHAAPAAHSGHGSAHAGHGDAVEMTVGEVKKVDKEAGKITLRHGELKNLGMGAMTMVFRVQSPAMLAQIKTGDQVKFVAERVNGAITVVQLVHVK
ncbi:copper-binding protein [Massilia soli]|uniref:Copper-binding protein n=1 Tax=Massilia soli TaxID=2792854 RepID=A0ABS7SMA5_9BURK|nr:copper-binding protein [Massilia soli]MBZ2207295.1 copper-binding protein [Massilia soli]